MVLPFYRMTIPYLFTICVAPYNTVDNRRLSSFRMGVFLADSINLDVLRVVYVDKLFINVRSISSGMIEGWVTVARLVSDLGSFSLVRTIRTE